MANRLHVYKRYLVPMLEYGAPLIYTWSQVNPRNKERFREAIKEWPKILKWIHGTQTTRWQIFTNLCGLATLPTRFETLHTLYQDTLNTTPTDSPLRRILQRKEKDKSSKTFANQLRNSPEWTRFKLQGNFQPTVSGALHRHLRKRHWKIVESNAQEKPLTSWIPMISRRVPGLYLADGIFNAAPKDQKLLLQYRLGQFAWGMICLCGKEFQRGHESCQELLHSNRLNKAQRQAKQQQESMMIQTTKGPLKKKRKFTDIDFQLNEGRFTDVVKYLTILRKVLGDAKTHQQKIREILIDDTGPGKT